MDVRVTDDPAEQRYEVFADEALAGWTMYRARPGLVAFVHTEIATEYEGEGLASRLIAFALNDARARGLAVLPFCPFVNGYMQRHPEYVDLVPENYRAQFGL
jgi:predicted GNAT family acetyltransferase